MARKRVVLALTLAVAVCFVYVPLVQADNYSIELITGNFSASYNGGTCDISIAFSGTGDIGGNVSGNCTALQRYYYSQCSSSEEVQADIEALADMAKTYGFTVGNITEDDSSGVGVYYRAEFVCQGKRKRIIRIIGELLKEALLLSQPAP